MERYFTIIVALLALSAGYVIGASNDGPRFTTANLGNGRMAIVDTSTGRARICTAAGQCIAATDLPPLPAGAALIND